MIGPKRKPQEFGFKTGDSHLIVNDISETMKAFSFDGELLWEIPCLARGQGSDREWQARNSDTPPGLYKLGAVYRDYEFYGPEGRHERDCMSYGWYSFDMVDLEGNENAYRAGIMVHGGGSALGWPGAWAPHQRLLPTLGCVRLRNADLRDRVLPLYEQGTVFVSVFQES